METWIAIGSLVVAFGSAILAGLALHFNSIQARAAESSAKAAEASAKLAERAIIENIKPVINLVIRKNSDETIYKDEEHFYFFDIFLQNIGNRGCKNVVVKITPSIYVERYFGETKDGDLGILDFEDRTTKSVGYRKFPLLNPKSQISFTGYGEMTCVAISGASKHTFMIEYQDLDGNQQKAIKINSSILELEQETLLK